MFGRHLHHSHPFSILLDAEGAEGNGGGGGSGGGTATAPSPPASHGGGSGGSSTRPAESPRLSREEAELLVGKAVESILAKHNGKAEDAVKTLLKEGRNYRKTIKELKTELQSKLPPEGAVVLTGKDVDRWKALPEIAAKVPAEGSVVLTGDDAARWAAFTELGDPAEVKTKLQEHSDLQGRLLKVDREKLIGRAAKSHGSTGHPLNWDAEVLATLIGDMPIEVKEETKNGKKVDVSYVKDGDKLTPLDKFAEERFPKFLASLKSTAAPPAHPTPPRNGVAPVPRPEPEPNPAPRPTAARRF